MIRATVVVAIALAVVTVAVADARALQPPRGWAGPTEFKYNSGYRLDVLTDTSKAMDTVQSFSPPDDVLVDESGEQSGLRSCRIDGTAPPGVAVTDTGVLQVIPGAEGFQSVHDVLVHVECLRGPSEEHVLGRTLVRAITPDCPFDNAAPGSPCGAHACRGQQQSVGCVYAVTKYCESLSGDELRNNPGCSPHLARRAAAERATQPRFEPSRRALNADRADQKVQGPVVHELDLLADQVLSFVAPQAVAGAAVSSDCTLTSRHAALERAVHISGSKVTVFPALIDHSKIDGAALDMSVVCNSDSTPSTVTLKLRNRDVASRRRLTHDGGDGEDGEANDFIFYYGILTVYTGIPTTRIFLLPSEVAANGLTGCHADPNGPSIPFVAVDDNGRISISPTDGTDGPMPDPHGVALYVRCDDHVVGVAAVRVAECMFDPAAQGSPCRRSQCLQGTDELDCLEIIDDYCSALDESNPENVDLNPGCFPMLPPSLQVQYDPPTLVVSPDSEYVVEPTLEDLQDCRPHPGYLNELPGFVEVLSSGVIVVNTVGLADSQLPVDLPGKVAVQCADRIFAILYLLYTAESRTLPEDFRGRWTGIMDVPFSHWDSTGAAQPTCLPGGATFQIPVVVDVSEDPLNQAFEGNPTPLTETDIDGTVYTFGSGHDLFGEFEIVSSIIAVGDSSSAVATISVAPDSPAELRCRAILRTEDSDGGLLIVRNIYSIGVRSMTDFVNSPFDMERCMGLATDTTELGRAPVCRPDGVAITEGRLRSSNLYGTTFIRGIFGHPQVFTPTVGASGTASDCTMKFVHPDGETIEFGSEYGDGDIDYPELQSILFDDTTGEITLLANVVFGPISVVVECVIGGSVDLQITVETCPFDALAPASPCYAPQCEARESQDCVEHVVDFCAVADNAANPVNRGCLPLTPPVVALDFVAPGSEPSGSEPAGGVPEPAGVLVVEWQQDLVVEQIVPLHSSLPDCEIQPDSSAAASQQTVDIRSGSVTLSSRPDTTVTHVEVFCGTQVHGDFIVVTPNRFSIPFEMEGNWAGHIENPFALTPGGPASCLPPGVVITAPIQWTFQQPEMTSSGLPDWSVHVNGVTYGQLPFDPFSGLKFDSFRQNVITFLDDRDGTPRVVCAAATVSETFMELIFPEYHSGDPLEHDFSDVFGLERCREFARLGPPAAACEEGTEEVRTGSAALHRPPPTGYFRVRLGRVIDFEETDLHPIAVGDTREIKAAGELSGCTLSSDSQLDDVAAASVIVSADGTVTVTPRGDFPETVVILSCDDNRQGSVTISARACPFRAGAVGTPCYTDDCIDPLSSVCLGYIEHYCGLPTTTPEDVGCFPLWSPTELQYATPVAQYDASLPLLLELDAGEDPLECAAADPQSLPSGIVVLPNGDIEVLPGLDVSDFPDFVHVRTVCIGTVPGQALAHAYIIFPTNEPVPSQLSGYFEGVAHVPHTHVLAAESLKSQYEAQVCLHHDAYATSAAVLRLGIGEHGDEVEFSVDSSIVRTRSVTMATPEESVAFRFQRYDESRQVLTLLGTHPDGTPYLRCAALAMEHGGGQAAIGFLFRSPPAKGDANDPFHLSDCDGSRFQLLGRPTCATDGGQSLSVVNAVAARKFSYEPVTAWVGLEATFTPSDDGGAPLSGCEADWSQTSAPPAIQEAVLVIEDATVIVNSQIFEFHQEIPLICDLDREGSITVTVLRCPFAVHDTTSPCFAPQCDGQGRVSPACVDYVSEFCGDLRLSSEYESARLANPGCEPFLAAQPASTTFFYDESASRVDRFRPRGIVTAVPQAGTPELTGCTLIRTHPEYDGVVVLDDGELQIPEFVTMPAILAVRVQCDDRMFGSITFVAPSGQDFPSELQGNWQGKVAIPFAATFRVLPPGMPAWPFAPFEARCLRPGHVIESEFYLEIAADTMSGVRVPAMSQQVNGELVAVGGMDIISENEAFHSFDAETDVLVTYSPALNRLSCWSVGLSTDGAVLKLAAARSLSHPPRADTGDDYFGLSLCESVPAHASAVCNMEEGEVIVSLSAGRRFSYETPNVNHVVGYPVEIAPVSDGAVRRGCTFSLETGNLLAEDALSISDSGVVTVDAAGAFEEVLVSVSCDDGKQGSLTVAAERCPFDPSLSGSPCFAGECADRASTECLDYVTEYCEGLGRSRFEPGCFPIVNPQQSLDYGGDSIVLERAGGTISPVEMDPPLSGCEKAPGFTLPQGIEVTRDGRINVAGGERPEATFVVVHCDLRREGRVKVLIPRRQDAPDSLQGLWRGTTTFAGLPMSGAFHQDLVCPADPALTITAALQAEGTTVGSGSFSFSTVPTYLATSTSALHARHTYGNFPTPFIPSSAVFDSYDAVRRRLVFFDEQDQRFHCMRAEFAASGARLLVTRRLENGPNLDTAMAQVDLFGMEACEDLSGAETAACDGEDALDTPFDAVMTADLRLQFGYPSAIQAHVGREHVEQPSGVRGDPLSGCVLTVSAPTEIDQLWAEAGSSLSDDGTLTILAGDRFSTSEFSIDCDEGRSATVTVGAEYCPFKGSRSPCEATQCVDRMSAACVQYTIDYCAQRSPAEELDNPGCLPFLRPAPPIRYETPVRKATGAGRIFPLVEEGSDSLGLDDSTTGELIAAEGCKRHRKSPALPSGISILDDGTIVLGDFSTGVHDRQLTDVWIQCNGRRFGRVAIVAPSREEWPVAFTGRWVGSSLSVRNPVTDLCELEVHSEREAVAFLIEDLSTEILPEDGSSTAEFLFGGATFDSWDPDTGRLVVYHPNYLESGLPAMLCYHADWVGHINAGGRLRLSRAAAFTELGWSAELQVQEFEACESLVGGLPATCDARAQLQQLIIDTSLQLSYESPFVGIVGRTTQLSPAARVPLSGCALRGTDVELDLLGHEVLDDGGFIVDAKTAHPEIDLEVTCDDERRGQLTLRSERCPFDVREGHDDSPCFAAVCKGGAQTSLDCLEYVQTYCRSVTQANKVYNPGCFPWTVDDGRQGSLRLNREDLAVDEGGSSRTFSVRLGTRPAVDVTVNIRQEPFDSGLPPYIRQLGISPIRLVFTPDDWNAAQGVTVAAVDDDFVEDANVHGATILVQAESFDDHVNGLTASVTVTCTDNDYAGLVASEDSIQLSEVGETSAIYYLNLATPPIEEVTVHLTSRIEGALTFHPTSILFSRQFNYPYRVIVTAVDDDIRNPLTNVNDLRIITNGVKYELDTDDLVYSLLEDEDLRPGPTVIVADDDTAGAVVSTSAISVIEGGSESESSGTYTIALSSAPLAGQTVAITITSKSPKQVSVDPAEIEFTADDYNVPQTVTVAAVDDSVVEETTEYLIEHAADASGAFAGLKFVTMVTVEDIDTCPFRLTDDSPCYAKQCVGGSSTKTTECIEFVREYCSQAETPLQARLPSEDPGCYPFRQASGVAGALSVTMGFAFQQHTQKFVVTEGSASGEYEISLLQRPGLAVTISLTTTPIDSPYVPPGTAQVSVSPTELVFEPAAYDTAQTVTVTAIDDLAVESDTRHGGTISHEISSEDELFIESLSIADISVHCLDNDAAGISISQTAFTVLEDGATSETYDVSLTSTPTGDVTVDIRVEPEGQVTLSETRLVFNAEELGPTTITVTAIDDENTEGDPHFVTLTHSISVGEGGTQDYAYHPNLIEQQELLVTIDDNDQAGIDRTVTTLAVTEAAGAGQSATTDIVLHTKPTASVTVSIQASTQFSSSPRKLTFTTANWDTPQTVTVTAVDDALDEDDTHEASITYRMRSTDAFYDRYGICVDDEGEFVGAFAGCTETLRSLPDVVDTVSITDDDTAGVVITVGTADATETAGADLTASLAAGVAAEDEDDITGQDGVADYVITLSSRPRSAVTVTIVADDDVITQPRGNIVFGTDDELWSDGVAVNVVGYDDAMIEGDEVISLSHTVRSADLQYHAFAVVDEDFTISDDDSAGVTVTNVLERSGATVCRDVAVSRRQRSQLCEDSCEAGVGCIAGTPATCLCIEVEDESDLVAGEGDTSLVSAVDVVLTSQPSSSVVVVLEAPDDSRSETVTDGCTGEDIVYSEDGPQVKLALRSSEERKDSIELSFTALDWNIPRRVSFYGVDDRVDEGGNHRTQISLTVESSDNDYQGAGFVAGLPDVWVTVTENDAAAPAAIASAKFTDLMNSIIVRFDARTVRPFSGLSCTNLFAGATATDDACATEDNMPTFAEGHSVEDVFGTGAICRWRTTTSSPGVELIIQLQPDAEILPNDLYVWLQPNVIGRTAAAERFSFGATQIALPDNPPTPNIEWQTFDSLGVCNDLVIDATASSGGGGRPLTLIWSVADTGGASADNKVAILSTVTAANEDGLRVLRVGRDLLESGLTYDVTLAARNFLYDSVAETVRTFSFTKASLPVPTIRINGAESRTDVLRSASLTLTTWKSTVQCAGVEVSVDLSFGWIMESGDLDVDDAAIADQDADNLISFDGQDYKPLVNGHNDPSKLRIAPGTLTVGQSYTFRAFVFDADGNSNSDFVDITSVLASPLSASINGGASDLSSGLEDVALDASGSVDPDEGADVATYTWTCNLVDSDDATAGTCLDDAGDPIVIDDGVNTVFPAGDLPLATETVVRITLTFAKDTRTSAASLDITVAGCAGTCPSVSVSCEACGSEVANVDGPVMVGSITADTTFVTEWRQLDVGGYMLPASDIITPTTSPNLQINTFSLESGDYAFRLIATTDAGDVAFAEASFTVNSPPSGGSLLACLGAYDGNPANCATTGQETDAFTFTASNWLDTDIPIKYLFGIAAGDASVLSVSNPGSPLAAASEENSLVGTISIPDGGAESSLVAVGVLVEDAIGSQEFVSAELTVTELTDPYASCIDKAEDEIAILEAMGDAEGIAMIVQACTDAINNCETCGTDSRRLASHGRRLHGGARRLATLEERIGLRDDLVDSYVTAAALVTLDSATMIAQARFCEEQAEVAEEVSDTARGQLLTLIETIADEGYTGQTVMPATAGTHLVEALSRMIAVSEILDADDDDALMTQRQDTRTLLRKVGLGRLRSTVADGASVSYQSSEFSLFFQKRDPSGLGDEQFSLSPATGSSISSLGATIVLPSGTALLDGVSTDDYDEDVVSIVGEMFKTNPRSVEPTNGLASDVMSFSVLGNSDAELGISELSSPLTITLDTQFGQFSAISQDKTCAAVSGAFDAVTAWDRRGCVVDDSVAIINRVVCVCNHLSDFAATLETRARVVLSATSVSLDEADAATTATYTVVLGAQPELPDGADDSTAVVITLASNTGHCRPSGTGYGTAEETCLIDGDCTGSSPTCVTPTTSTISPSTLTFTTSNWDEAQTVTVTVADDDFDEPDSHSTLITATSVSSDPRYSSTGLTSATALSIDSVTVTIADDDTAGVSLTGSPEVAEEGTTSDTYTVVLTSEPFSDVTVTIDPEAQLTLDDSELVFTPANWDTPQTVEATAVDDDLDEADEDRGRTHQYSLVHTVTSDDTAYASVVSLVVSIADNDETTEQDAIAQAAALTAELGVTEEDPSADEIDALWDADVSEAVQLKAVDRALAASSSSSAVVIARQSVGKRGDLATDIVTATVTAFPREAATVIGAVAKESSVSDEDTETLVSDSLTTILDSRSSGNDLGITPGAVAIEAAKSRPSIKAALTALVKARATASRTEAVSEANGGEIEVEADDVYVQLSIPPGANTGGGNVEINVLDCTLVSSATDQTGSCVSIDPHTFASDVTVNYAIRSNANRCYKATDETSDDWQVLSVDDCSISNGIASYSSTTFSVFDGVNVQLSSKVATSRVSGHRCPNGCSGHGSCSIESTCTCEVGFTGGDCSLRLCPEGVSWDSREMPEDVPQPYAECSNRGACNRKTGLCKCAAGFEGDRCQRMSCPRGLPYGRANEVTPTADPVITRVTVTAPNADRLKARRARARAGSVGGPTEVERARAKREAQAVKLGTETPTTVREKPVFTGPASEARERINALKRKRRGTAQSPEAAKLAAAAAEVRAEDTLASGAAVADADGAPTVTAERRPQLSTSRPPPKSSGGSQGRRGSSGPTVNTTRGIKRAVMPDRPRPPETSAMRRARAEAEERRKLSKLVCSGHGTCEFAADLSPDYGATHWDSYMVRGCRCDGGWRGPDCSQRYCPRGDNPDTVPQSFVGEVRTIVLSTADEVGSAPLSGQAHWITMDYTGVTYHSRPWDITSATEALAALLDCDNVQSVVSLTLETDNPSGNLFTTTITITMESPSRMGDIWIDGDDNQDNAGSYPKRLPISGGLSTIDYSVVDGEELYEFEECSNHGLCDTAEGKCICFEGYSGIACNSKTIYA